MLGLADLNRALEALPKATARNTLKRVLTKAAKPIEDDADAKAPKRTGALEKSIITGTRLTRPQAKQAKKDGKFFAEVHVGTADPAGIFQEFGTFSNAAQPFLRPAWEANKDRALQIIKDELGTEIEKPAARLARKAARG